MASTSSGDKTITGYLKKIIGHPIGQLIPLTDSVVTIGRTKKSEICINDPNISRSHCTLHYSTDGWFIKDLGGVNGTFLDGVRLTPHVSHPLKDGLGIYLGPPAEAPFAFVFIKNKHEDEASRMDQVKIERVINFIDEVAPLGFQNDHPSLKRRANSKHQNASDNAFRRKKHASASTSHLPVSDARDLNSQSTDGHDSENANVSDCSISSLDSLRTRIRKINSSGKKKKHNPTQNIDHIYATSMSASPRTSLHNPLAFDCIPSTSSAHQVDRHYTMPNTMENLTILKCNKPDMFKELDALLNDGSDSVQEATNESEDSESLLNDSVLLTDVGTYPYSRPLETSSSSSTKPSNDMKHSVSSKTEQKISQDLNKQLKEAHYKLLKENLEQRRKLNQLMEESKAKEDGSTKLGSMLEEELICNICTEVFIKATTLGCSHTFCEHCILEWRKKQPRCPICREKITSVTRVLIMDNFINKVVEKLGKEYQDKRKDVMDSREAAKIKEKKPKKKKAAHSRRGRNAQSLRSRFTMPRDSPESMRQIRLNLLDEVPFRILDIGLDDFNYMSDDSDLPDEHFMYCYNCGRNGHFSNTCPQP